MGDDRGVVSVMGDVVRRPASPWTGTIHSLLQHLCLKGLPVPEPLELTPTHEVLRFVPGEAGERAWFHQSTVAGVRSAGRLLRCVHDATVDWQVPPGAVWSVPVEGGPIIAHGDPKPPNMTWSDCRAIGLFDWDAARPAERVSDIAYALYWFAPFDVDEIELQRRCLPIGVDSRRRIEAFLDGYGWDESGDLDAVIAARRHRAVDEVVHAARMGCEPQASWIREGVPPEWLQPPRLA
ncbi:aminoglycoside phosphotransferase family protein [Luteococcus sediminum]